MTLAHPDMRRRLKDRLLDLSPRAFELFAGDLLVYVGLQHVAVTRYAGDGGIDAHGELIATSGLVRVHAGVQVKRHRHNVRRPDIDAFIGAYGGQYDRGIFITTAGYARQAREKATSSPLLRVDIIDGNQVAELMRRHELGVTVAPTPRLDEHYFLAFEAQAMDTPARQVRETRAAYLSDSALPGVAVRPEDDLISLRALSYALRVDMQTVRRRWVETGKLRPDTTRLVGGREAHFFRRDRLDEIRRVFLRSRAPVSSDEWRQEFLDFARSRHLTRSYKPVMLKALLHLVNRDGEAKLDDLAHAFHAFYVQRQHDGLPVEYGVPLLDDPSAVSLEDMRKLILKNPLDRFIIKGFLEYAPEEGIVRFAPLLWDELRFHELLEIQASLDEQIRYYYERGESR